MDQKDKKYIIKTDKRTQITVLEHQLFRDKWVKYFGSVENVIAFKDNYDKERK